MSARIVRLTDSQIPAAAAALARAFHDDPLMIYAIPDRAERVRLLPDVYARMIRFGVLAGEVYATAGALEGVALWLPPNAKWTRENIEASGMHQMPALIGNDAYQRYREVVGREWQARERDMTGSCWYLFLLGVEPSSQRRGLGGALMRPGLERADAEQVACYLETENERNVAFYLKQGFEMIVNGEEAGASGVRFWTFRRMPQRV
ncbi:MAG TPA: GNAT family N-acetyltransferase [Candidatus Binatus sp.]|uniref:GNAT family N-acetyltransferase n=1 Tax=Candidatus Binatus sp. TaxID=2811406 RepID=UPI002B474753|nr:GNAT family N-acetyltransferase [Candidatus Binatus sp.]HKN13301.1 GNAT family N-acetyltransferase [Candidatus Binatus sp.]